MQLAINLDVAPDDLITAYGAGAKLYLYSAATEDGAYTLVASTTIVATQWRYELYDAAGTPGVTWYKFRAGNLANDAHGPYSDPWLSTSLAAYATLDDLKRTIKTVSDDNDDTLEDYLRDASAFLDAQLGRRFYRDPQVTGTTTKTFRVVSRDRSLARAVGRGIDIVSVSSVTWAGGTGHTPATLEATDWVLLEPEHAGFPSPDLVLSDVGSYSSWSTGFDTVAITGVFGFPEVPDMIRRATIEIAREMHRQGPGGASAVQGVNQYGVPVFLTGYPPTVKAVLAPGSIFRNQSFVWV